MGEEIRGSYIEETAVDVGGHGCCPRGPGIGGLQWCYTSWWSGDSSRGRLVLSFTSSEGHLWAGMSHVPCLSRLKSTHCPHGCPGQGRDTVPRLHQHNIGSGALLMLTHERTGDLCGHGSGAHASPFSGRHHVGTRPAGM